jgi:hypothetical protein
MITTIRLDERLGAKLMVLAGEQPFESFVELLVNAALEEFVGNVQFEGRLPVVPVPPGLRTVTTEEVSRLI